ncbi:hypothetical protein HI914_00062 [Erysiphe necator]|nr:hypothetical protein HI914_00062 [Erysiphe necator]
MIDIVQLLYLKYCYFQAAGFVALMAYETYAVALSLGHFRLAFLDPTLFGPLENKKIRNHLS